MTLRPEYLAWRDEVFLAKFAQIMHARPTARAEAEDLHRALGELIGVGGRGGVRTKEVFVPCGRAKRVKCETCRETPGHGPYLYRKEGRRWVRVKESDDEQAERRRRALDELRGIETQHALALLEAAHGEAEGLLEGEAAEEARRRVLESIHS